MKIRMMFRAVPAAVLIAATGGCSDGLTELNENPNQPVSVGAEFLVPSAIVAGAERLQGSSLNMDMVGLWVQHYAEHRYAIEDRYEFQDVTINGHWSTLYENPLRDLYEVKQKGREAEWPNVEAVGMILTAWIMQVVTDLWGDTGYSKALLGRDSPPDMTVEYDTQEQIYDALMSELASAAGMVSSSGAKIQGGDLLYGGNMDKWRLFANSLRLRMAVRLSDVDPGLAASEAASAISGGVFSSNSDNATLHFIANGVDVHPIYGYERNRDDHSISATMVDTLKALNDPRLPVYARPNQLGQYKGTQNGDMSDPPLNEVSRIGTWFSSADTPAILLSYAEVLLLRAEAAERGWVSGNAGQLYNEAITAAMSLLGVASGDINTYLAQPRVQYQGGQAGLDQIHLQKWIALFGNGPEAYAEWRRTGIPHLVAGPDAINDGQIPVRLPYPDQEKSLNREAVEAAIARQNGATINTPVWWDKN